MLIRDVQVSSCVNRLVARSSNNRDSPVCAITASSPGLRLSASCHLTTTITAPGNEKHRNCHFQAHWEASKKRWARSRLSRIVKLSLHQAAQNLPLFCPKLAQKNFFSAQNWPKKEKNSAQNWPLFEVEVFTCYWYGKMSPSRDFVGYRRRLRNSHIFREITVYFCDGYKRSLL